jgi:hypothetical protein
MKEEGQYGSSYPGFIVTDRAGKRRFAVRGHQGSFPWGDFAVSERIEASKTASIELMFILNESGTLGGDDISVSYD